MSILAAVFTFSMIFGMNAMASSRTETIILQKNQVWNVREYVTRSQEYSQVSARCYSVYPVGKKDTLKKIQVVARNIAGNNITNVNILNEEEGTFTLISIKEDYLNTSKVVFAFRGNDPEYPANADVFYNGR